MRLLSTCITLLLIMAQLSYTHAAEIPRQYRGVWDLYKSCKLSDADKTEFPYMVVTGKEYTRYGAWCRISKVRRDRESKGHKLTFRCEHGSGKRFSATVTWSVTPMRARMYGFEMSRLMLRADGFFGEGVYPLCSLRARPEQVQQRLNMDE